MVYIDKGDKDIYLKMLNILSNYCDNFNIVEYYPDKDESLMSNVLISLKKYLINKTKVLKWPGTEIMCHSDEDLPIQHEFLCNHKSVNVLTDFSWFFDIEVDGNLDISFYRNGECVLYTTCHENICVINVDVFQSINDIRIIKEQE